ncbi:MAG TPA: ABC transporter permease [Pseudonocardiaceae bacterium]|jgi:ribose transport system permease protein|nr:ABC transporter permease [Pseudonocardiaceae bacterium]
MTTVTSPRGDQQAVVADTKGTWWARISKSQAAQIVLVLAIIVVVFSVLAPGKFLTPFNIRTTIQDTSILAVLGVGMTFVIITGGIDLSVGSVLVFSGVIADKVMVAMGGQGWGASVVGILVACVCGTGWGFLNGVLVAKARVPALIVTLGTLGMALGFSQIITGGVDLRDAPDVLASAVFANLGGQIPVLSIIALVVVVIGAIVLHRTRFGLYTYAVGSNAEAGRRVGVKVDRQLVKVYTVAGLTAGVAGILNLAFFQSTTIAGQSQTNLNVIAGVVIGGTSLFGGTGLIFGTVIGLFIPSVLQNGFIILGVQSFWQQVVVGAVLIAAVYLDQARRAAASHGSTLQFPFLSRAGSGARKVNR